MAMGARTSTFCGAVPGRGRTAALAVPLSASLSPAFARQWGEGGDNRHYARFARNLVYWLTEDSAIGRRRLVANTDKRFYRPGEPVALSAHTYDESANRTSRYRVEAILEPKQLLGAELPPCPVKWPTGRPRPAGASGGLQAARGATPRPRAGAAVRHQLLGAGEDRAAPGQAVGGEGVGGLGQQAPPLREVPGVQYNWY